jgi:type I restriction enzyme S subunit
MSKMLSDWRKVKLGDVASFRTGKLNSNAATPNGPYPFFTCSQETARTNTCSFDTECVLLAGNNANGIFPLKYFHGKFDAYQRTYVVESIDKSTLDTRYLYYSLRPKLGLMQSVSTGAATKFLTLTILNGIEISLPPLATQRRIAAILSAYDDLIENNARRITILEEMAQALYREWFVEFRFPGHERVEVKDGVPEGWEEAHLVDLVKNVREAAKPGPATEAMPYLPIDCIPRRSLALTESRPGSEAQSSLISFEKHDVLFGAMRSYFHKVAIAPFEGTTRATCFVLRPIERAYYSFAVLTLFDGRTVDYSHKHSRGSTMPYAVWDGSLGNMPIIRPPRPIAQAFDEIVKPMVLSVEVAFFRQKNLRETRDLLLPRLVGGEIDVADLEIALE